MAEANLIGREASYNAQAERALALVKVIEARQSGKPRAVQKAWAQLRAAKEDQKDAESEAQATISGLGLWRTVGKTDALQYKLYIHGTQGTAVERHNKELLGEEGLAKRSRKAKTYNKAYAAQLAGFYGRAMAAMKAAADGLKAPAEADAPAAEGAPNAPGVAPNAAEVPPNAAGVAANDAELPRKPAAVAPKGKAGAPNAKAGAPKAAAPAPAKAR
jgi:hypothetical protein